MAIYFLMRQNSESLNFIGSSRTRTVDKTSYKKHGKTAEGERQWIRRVKIIMVKL